jgi:hypothetical protein
LRESAAQLRSLAGDQNPLVRTGYLQRCIRRTGAIFGLHYIVKVILTKPLWAKVTGLVSNWERQDLIGHGFAGGALSGWGEEVCRATCRSYECHGLIRLFALRRQQNARAIQRASHGMITKL